MSDDKSRSRDAVLEEAFAILGWGARRIIGEACGITSQAVSDWTRVPVEHVIEVERLTGIPRELLRPDIYGAPRPRPPKAVAAADL